MIIVLKILIAASFSFSIHSTDIPPVPICILGNPLSRDVMTLTSIFSSLAGSQLKPKSSGDYPNFFEQLYFVITKGKFQLFGNC